MIGCRSKKKRENSGEGMQSDDTKKNVCIGDYFSPATNIVTPLPD